MKCALELVTIDDVKAFTEAVKDVKSDVRLTGKDENGNEWTLSGKSLLCSLIVPVSAQVYREHTAHEVDWNTIWCVCEQDIFHKISDYVVVDKENEE